MSSSLLSALENKDPMPYDSLWLLRTVIQNLRNLHPHTFPILKGMLAFGLEECGEYAKAEAAGQEALRLNRQDAWATHALAHVYEMGPVFGLCLLKGSFLSSSL